MSSSLSVADRNGSKVARFLTGGLDQVVDRQAGGIARERESRHDEVAKLASGEAGGLVNEFRPRVEFDR